MQDFNSIDKMQEYFEEFVKEKGFHQETASDLMLLLQEELGELARTVRHMAGLKVDSRAKKLTKEDLAYEITDCITYLMILANKFAINLPQAFHRKHQKDCDRVWISQNSE